MVNKLGRKDLLDKYTYMNAKKGIHFFFSAKVREDSNRVKAVDHCVCCETASFLRCSVNTCSDASSVSTLNPSWPGPYVWCVADGLTLAERMRAGLLF